MNNLCFFERFEEETHKPGTSYTWESIDQVTANFTPDITPLVLAGKIIILISWRWLYKYLFIMANYKLKLHHEKFDITFFFTFQLRETTMKY